MKSKKIISGLMTCVTLLSVVAPIVSSADSLGVLNDQSTPLEAKAEIVTPKITKISGRVISGVGNPTDTFYPLHYLQSSITISLKDPGMDTDTEYGIAHTDENGNWSFTLPDDAPQTERLTITQYTSWSDSSILVDTKQVSYEGPSMDGNLQEGDTSVSGYDGIPGDTILISTGEGVQLGRGTVNSDGRWTATLTQPLVAGAKVYSNSEIFYSPRSHQTVNSALRPLITPLKVGATTIYGARQDYDPIEVWMNTLDGNNPKKLGTIGDTPGGVLWQLDITTDVLTPGTYVQGYSPKYGWGDKVYAAFQPTVLPVPKDGDTMLSGTGQVGGNFDVWMIKPDGSKTQLGTTVVDATGHWSLAFTNALVGGGSVQFNSTQLGWSNTTYISTQPIISENPKQGDTSLSGTGGTTGDEIQIWTNTPNGNNKKLVGTVNVSAEKDWNVTLTEALVAGNTVQPHSGEFGWGDVMTVASKPIINRPKESQNDIDGTATPGATVEIWTKNADGSDNTKLGTVTADSNGNWILNMTNTLPGGTIIQVKSNDFGPGDTVTVISKPVITSSLVDPFRTVSGTSSPGAKITFWVILNDGTMTENGTTTADASGNWSLTPIENFAPGHKVQVESNDYGFGDIMLISGV